MDDEILFHPLFDNNSDLSTALATSDISVYETSKEQAAKHLDLYNKTDAEDDTALVIEAFLKNLPKLGSLNLMTEIIDLCSQEGHQRSELKALRNFLVDAVLKPMLNRSTNYSDSISASTSSAATPEIDALMTSIQSTSKLKQQCLIRDAYKCVVTGHMDRPSVKKLRLSVPPQVVINRTKLAHILPVALRKFDGKYALQTRNTATVLWALCRYFPALIGKQGIATGDLEGAINQPANTFPLIYELHADFDEYCLSFEPTGPNTYSVHRDGGHYDRILPATVTFVPNGDIPVPDPDFFDTHHRIRRILLVSGIRHKIQSSIDDQDIYYQTTVHPDKGDMIRRWLLTSDASSG